MDNRGLNDDDIYEKIEFEYLTKRFKNREMKYVDSSLSYPNNKPIHNPLFHDLIKSLLDHYWKHAYEICKNTPQLKKSKLFRSDAYWKLCSKQQEYPFDWGTRADVVWFFAPDCDTTTTPHPPEPRYCVIHEVKTGTYDIDDIFRKYYNGSHSQIWIWGWNELNKESFPNKNGHAFKLYKRGHIKKSDIEYLLPLLKLKFPELKLEGVDE